jgi:hypothetical protein
MKTTRLKEASTWASLAAGFAALSSIPVFAPYAMPATAICTAIGIFLREGNNETK